MFPISQVTKMPHNNCSFNETIVSSPAATSIGALILTIVFLLGLPGNLFVIWSILARARKQSVTTLLILNLAIADGSLMALTPFFIAYLIKMDWAMGNVMCKVLFYLCLANMYASIYLIMLMSVYRLVSVVWPQRISVITGKRTIMRVLGVVWLLVMVASIPALIYREVKCKENGQGSVCDSFHDKDSEVSLRDHSYPIHLLCEQTRARLNFPLFFPTFTPNSYSVSHLQTSRWFYSTRWSLFWAFCYLTESF